MALRDLEAQTGNQSQTASFSRTIAAKRKATTSAPVGNNNYYNNPATQGNMGAGPSTQRRAGSGAMPPPPVNSSASASRSYYPSANGSASTGHSNNYANNRPANGGQTLYSSILAPPPAKQARTIHNPNDPPLPAPSRPSPDTPRSSRGTGPRSARSIAEGTRAQARSRRVDDKPNTKTKAKRVDKGKGKQKQPQHRAQTTNVELDGDLDMKAAATLTSLLFQHRPSITSLSADSHSPRSTVSMDVDGSESGSTHFAQSSARTTTTLVAASIPPPTDSSASSFIHGTSTPPPITSNVNTTPRPAPTDNEAADLMLYLATSPSPARPKGGKDSRDQAAYRALGGSSVSGGLGLRAKGRVLFPGGDGVGGSSGLSRSALSADDSFTSTVSSLAGEGSRSNLGSTTQPGSRHGSISAIAEPTVTNLTATQPTPSSFLLPASTSLLPPPPSPSFLHTARRSSVDSHRPMTDQKPVSPGVGTSKPSSPRLQQSAMPGTLFPGKPFNINDFINVSPSSPARSGSLGSLGTSGSLRADVGRKLFEEEQLRLMHQGMGNSGGVRPGKGTGTGNDGPEGKGTEERMRPSLGAGIDLVQS